jgi:hypothetical protein
MGNGNGDDEKRDRYQKNFLATKLLLGVLE